MAHGAGGTERAMDFSRVRLSEQDQAFHDEVRAFLAAHVTEDVRRRDHETGDNFDESVHLAMGAAGYLASEWQPEADGGFSRVRRRIWGLEKRRAHVPWVTWGTTAMIARSVQSFGSQELQDQVMPGVFRGDIRFCLGYTEPEGGSDVATCKTRAVRDGAGWVINGSKMFTTGAHVCQYVFLITNTDPVAPKHKSLTMFLVPLDSPGIEIQGIRTVDGDRTNIVYYSDVRVDEKYRLGPVNGGWAVLREPLNVEHGDVAAGEDGLADVSIMMHQAGFMAAAVDHAAATVAKADPSGRRLLDGQSVAYRLGRSVARMEAAFSTPGIFGRVANAQTMRDISPDLMDVLGAASVLPPDGDGVDYQSTPEYTYRFAPLLGIYGGTLEVFRNMIAQHALGLGKPSYAPPATKPVS
jgi:alkylation response protein AidB-like acyl-CoA dehydrogenase